MLAIAYKGNSVEIRDVNSGSTVCRLTGHKDLIADMAFSPDGQRLVTASWDNTARLWEIKTGTLISTLQRHRGPVSHVRYATTGKYIVTGSNDHQAILWEPTDGSHLLTLKGHEGRINSVDLSPDDRYLLTASADKTMRIWEVDSGEFTSVFVGGRDISRIIGDITSGVRFARFSLDGKRILTNGKGKFFAKLWGVKLP